MRDAPGWLSGTWERRGGSHTLHLQHNLPRAAADFTQIRTVRTLQQPIYRRFPQIPAASVSSLRHSLDMACSLSITAEQWLVTKPGSALLLWPGRGPSCSGGGWEASQGCGLMRAVKPIREAMRGRRAVCPSVSSGLGVLS